ncbi:MAK16 protein, putative [Eimeria acervulina]|uniref:Protein MAK16 homolog n=1 Tax=Eimeria acervulina TaxID=5801 RepID=U6GRX0_EIMAC|nr:MAK16 protein, putative [Eimeria acervulina]CDI82996.1 MAK16 protein, putative [Eimeria acervulina]
MQNDELIWNVINKHFCSFKRKTDKEDMCSNQYNVTGKCNRVSCPLANSNYGTVLENQGKLYLCLKTVERAHLPNRLWERIKLSRNISEAKKTIEKHMKNVYPQHQIERCKRRTIKLKHMIDRMRKLELKPKEKLEGVKKKTERREAAREKKALVAAHIEDVIEDELLKRLHQGVYGDLYNEHRLTKETTQEEKETPEVTTAKAAETGAIRFEAAAETDEEEFASSDFELDDDLEGSSTEGSEDEFSFSGSGSELEESESEVEDEDTAEKPAATKGKKKELLVDVEELQAPSSIQKKRKAAAERESKEKRDVPVSTLRRQAAKRKNTRMRIEYEPEAIAEEA